MTSTLETPTLTTCTDTLLIQTTAMSTTLTTSTLETPTLTILKLYAISLTSVIVAHALQVHSTLAYLPSPGNVNQIVTRVNPWRSRIPRTKATRNHGGKKEAQKQHPKPSPPSPPVTGALCAQIKETQQLPDHPPTPLTMESSYEDKKRHNQGSPPTPKKAECAQPTETHSPTIHPPYPFTMESFYRWCAEQGCPKINDDCSYSTRSIYDDVLVCYHQYGICTGTCPFPISHHDLFHPPQKSQPNRGIVVKDLVKKDPQEAEVTLSSESDSDSYYSDCFDSVSTPDLTPTNAHTGAHYAECTLNY
jgi:hypothetical protein